jgi:hypothetical protein
MTDSTAFHQLGRFIFLFQHVEAALTELLVLMTHADDEAIRILVNELEFNKRVKTTDVMFARTVDLRRNADEALKISFHKLMVEIDRLGTRRNEIVHSKYAYWVNVEGAHGLIRANSRLRGSDGVREEVEEELLPGALEADGDKVAVVLLKLESLRLQIIEWLYP